MLKEFLERLAADKRSQSNPLAPHLSPFAASLAEDGYADATTKAKLSLLSDFGEWLARRELSVMVLDERLVKKFINNRRQKGRLQRGDGETLSRCTESPNLNAFVFKWFPGFSYNAIVPRAQTSVLKAQTKFRLKIMRDLTTNDGDNRKLPRTVMRLKAIRFVLDLNAVCSCESGI